jgi:hypothetical protein
MNFRRECRFSQFAIAAANWNQKSPPGPHGGKEYENVQVTGILGEVPDEVRQFRAPEDDLSGKEWPDAQKIADVLLTYHQAKRDLELPFQAIPEALRHAVKDPDSVTPPR